MRSYTLIYVMKAVKKKSRAPNCQYACVSAFYQPRSIYQHAKHTAAKAAREKNTARKTKSCSVNEIGDKRMQSSYGKMREMEKCTQKHNVNGGKRVKKG